jgi:hypothetical protein
LASRRHLQEFRVILLELYSVRSAALAIIGTLAGASNENEVIGLLARDAIDLVVDRALADDSRSSTV